MMFDMHHFNEYCFRDMLVNCEISRQPQPAVILWDVDINLMNLILDFMYIGEVKVYNTYIQIVIFSFFTMPAIILLSSCPKNIFIYIILTYKTLIIILAFLLAFIFKPFAKETNIVLHKKIYFRFLKEI